MIGRILTLHKELETLAAVQRQLNAEGLKTRSGTDWTAMGVQRIVKREATWLAASGARGPSYHQETHGRRIRRLAVRSEGRTGKHQHALRRLSEPLVLRLSARVRLRREGRRGRDEGEPLLVARTEPVAKQDCRNLPGCWLPGGHEGPCQPVSAPTYERGDFVKVEFAGEGGMPGEWMWVRVSRCDDEKQVVFGTLDSEPLNDYGGKIALGSELAVSFSQLREHRKPAEFTER